MIDLDELTPKEQKIYKSHIAKHGKLQPAFSDLECIFCKRVQDDIKSGKDLPVAAEDESQIVIPGTEGKKKRERKSKPVYMVLVKRTEKDTFDALFGSDNREKIYEWIRANAKIGFIYYPARFFEPEELVEVKQTKWK